MDRARAILSELKRRDWVDPDVHFDSVMAGLAEGRRAVSLIARERHRSQFFVKFSSGDADLLKELVEIARAPYLAMPWPDPPDLDLSRIVVDFERTTGRRLALDWRWEQFPDEGFWICDYAVDGEEDRGGIGEGWAEDDPEGNLVH